MRSQTDALCLYVDEEGVVFTCAASQLLSTTERHKVALRPSQKVGRDLSAALRDHAGVAGVVFELKRGWAGQSRLRAAGRILRRGLRAWWYRPSEETIECVDRERLASCWCHLLLIVTYLKLVVPLQDLKTRLRPSAKYLLRGSPPEPPVVPRAMKDIASRLESAVPVPAAHRDGLGRGLYLRTDFWAAISSGGSYGHTCYVAKELAAAGSGLTCLLAQGYPLLDDLGIPQIAIAPLVTENVSENDLVRGTAYYYPIAKAVVEAIRPDYIYERLVLGNYVGAALSQDLGLPYIVEYNGSEISMRRSFDGAQYIHESVYLKAEELAFAQATAISVVSEEIRSTLLARGVPGEKILVNPNGVDPDAYRPPDRAERDQVRRELGFAEDDSVIGFTGTFGGWHGVDVLAAAIPEICRRAPNARFLLIGDGNYKHLVDASVATHALQPKVRAVGRVPQAEGARLLRACDICVSPHSSHMVDSRFFGSPTKIFEYMALGVGIVASDLEQIGQVLSPGLRPSSFSGEVTVTCERSVLCQPGDVNEFVSGVLALVQRPAIAGALGRNAREAAVSEYSWARHVRRLTEFVTSKGAGPAHRVRAGLSMPAVAVGDAYKEQTELQWDNDPAGSHYVKEAEPHTLEWFKEVEAYRYEEYAPWMADTMEFARHAGERVLDIGGGIGTDLAQFADHGAIVTDVDLSSGHLSLARENFRLRGLAGEFVLHDAERLPFDDNWFDLVYSNGVLHHTPNTREVVREIFRVLKPGGRVIVMMYAENSLHYWRNLVWTIGLKERKLLEQSMGEILSRTVERSDNASARPLVKVYTKPRLQGMFDGFENIRIVQRQMVAAEVPRLLARVPVAKLGTLMGWNLIVKARKPSDPAATAVRGVARAETARVSGHR